MFISVSLPHPHFVRIICITTPATSSVGTVWSQFPHLVRNLSAGAEALVLENAPFFRMGEEENWQRRQRLQLSELSLHFCQVRSEGSYPTAEKTPKKINIFPNTAEYFLMPWCQGSSHLT